MLVFCFVVETRYIFTPCRFHASRSRASCPAAQQPILCASSGGQKNTKFPTYLQALTFSVVSLCCAAWELTFQGPLLLLRKAYLPKVSRAVGLSWHTPFLQTKGSLQTSTGAGSHLNPLGLHLLQKKGLLVGSTAGPLKVSVAGCAMQADLMQLKVTLQSLSSLQANSLLAAAGGQSRSTANSRSTTTSTV